MKYIKKLNINFNDWNEYNDSKIDNLIHKYNIKDNNKKTFIKFIKFLEEYDITDQFFNNLNRKFSFNITRKRQWISAAFDWKIDNYNWFDLHCKWLDKNLI